MAYALEMREAGLSEDVTVRSPGRGPYRTAKALSLLTRLSITSHIRSFYTIFVAPPVSPAWILLRLKPVISLVRGERSVERKWALPITRPQEVGSCHPQLNDANHRRGSCQNKNIGVNILDWTLLI